MIFPFLDLDPIQLYGSLCRDRRSSSDSSNSSDPSGNTRPTDSGFEKFNHYLASGYRSYEVKEAENGLEVKFMAPGVDLSKVKIERVGQTLFVKILDRVEKLRINSTLNLDSVKAKLNRGVLTLNIPYVKKTVIPVTE